MAARPPTSLWRGPQRAARLWASGLSAGDREISALRRGALGLPGVEMKPLRLVRASRRLSVGEKAFGEEATRSRLRCRVWRELSPEEVEKSAFMPSELTVDDDGSSKFRPVAGLSHLSKHWSPRLTKADALEANVAQLRPRGHLLSYDLKSGRHHFRLHPSMRKHFRVEPLGRLFEHISLPFGWRMSGYWLIRWHRGSPCCCGRGCAFARWHVSSTSLLQFISPNIRELLQFITIY